MANFYKIVRKKYNILMDDDKPRGGKWSYDSENRKKIPKNFQIPNIPQIKETNHTKILKDIVTKKFSKHPGDTKNFWIPTTQKDAEKWLNFFIKNKLNLFGDYEDAVDISNNFLFHSALSPLINLGLLTPEITVVLTSLVSVVEVLLYSKDPYPLPLFSYWFTSVAIESS